VSVAFQGTIEKAEATGDGGYDAFMNAVKKAAKVFDLPVPRLADYRVRIPPGGRTGALVEAQIAWVAKPSASKAPTQDTETFFTLGVDSDQMAAAVIATEKMLNAIAPNVSRKDAGSTTRPAKKSKRTRKTPGPKRR